MIFSRLGVAVAPMFSVSKRAKPPSFGWPALMTLLTASLQVVPEHCSGIALPVKGSAMMLGSRAFATTSFPLRIAVKFSSAVTRCFGSSMMPTVGRAASTVGPPTSELPTQLPHLPRFF